MTHLEFISTRDMPYFFTMQYNFVILMQSHYLLLARPSMGISNEPVHSFYMMQYGRI
jgi:hypothetical protein